MMNPIMRLKLFIITFALALLSITSGRAGLALFMAPTMQSGLMNNEIFLTGTLTNTSLTTNLYLNGIQIILGNPAANYLTADTNAFFANVPGILLPGEIYKDAVFGVAVGATAYPTNFSGTLTIFGGADIFSMNILATQTFQAVVPPAAMGIAGSGTNFVITWSSPPAGFTLQQASGLNTTNWLTVTNTPVLTNGQNQVVLPHSTNVQFYRLKYF